MKIKFIYWFAYYNLDSPSVRYRAKYPLDHFKSNFNIGSYLVIPGYSPKRIWIFLNAYFSALLFRKQNSLIVIQRINSNFIYARLLKLLVRLRNHDTVYDLDDADYLEVNPKTIYHFSKNCEKISAGSNQIGLHLRQFNKRIVHTSSPIVDLNIVKTVKNPIFTIGWIGGFGGVHKEGLIEFVFPAVKQLSFKCKLIVIGVVKPEDVDLIKKCFSEHSNIEIEIPLGIDWNDEKGIQKRIVSFDIGIATLKNSEIQLSKSGIKAKQYMNNGVPVLSTDLAENNAVIIDGSNGYFCSDSNEFKERLTEFFNMTNADYARFSTNARQSVVNFDHNKYFADFEKIKNL